MALLFKLKSKKDGCLDFSSQYIKFYYLNNSQFSCFNLDIQGLHSFMCCELISALVVLLIIIPSSLSVDYHSQMYSMHDPNRCMELRQ
jgi:hypothetical protein